MRDALVLATLVVLVSAVDADVPLVWFAPVLTGNGYGQEAVEFLAGLDPLVRKRAEMHPSGGSRKIVSSLVAQQHGDQPSMEAASGWEPPLHAMLSRLLLGWRRAIPLGVVAVCHSEPGAWSAPRPLYDTTACPPEHALLRIGRTMFETDRLPAGWAARLNFMHQVWVPSEFSRRIFIDGGVDADRVRVVHEPIDTARWSRDRVSARLAELWQRHNRQNRGTGGGMSGDSSSSSSSRTGGGGDGAAEHVPAEWNVFSLYPGYAWLNKKCKIRFLSVFKWEDRKGWDVLLSAFFQEFVASGRAEDATTCLIVKASAYHSDIEDGDDEEYEDVIVRYIRRRFKEQSQRMFVFSSHLPAEHFPMLYAATDCLVQPSRGEGWGRPHSEAMAMQLPVIATNWSGNTEYMVNERNALLIKVARMSEVPRGAFRGHRWAEPDEDHLRTLMRRVATAVAAEKGLLPRVAGSSGVEEREEVGTARSAAIEWLRRLRSQARRDMVEKYDSAIIARHALQLIDNLLRVQLYVPHVDEEVHRPPPEEPESAYEL